MAANAPIRSVLALDLNSTLRRVADHADGRSRRGHWLMSAEIAGAAALLVATIALTRLPVRIANSPPRFDASHVLAMNLEAFQRLPRNVNAPPGVEVDQQHPGIEIGRQRRQSQLAKVRQRMRRA